MKQTKKKLRKRMRKLERKLKKTLATADSVGDSGSDPIWALLLIARAINLGNLAKFELDAAAEKTTEARTGKTDMPPASRGFTTDPSH